MIDAGFSTASVDGFHEAQISHGMTFDDAPAHLKDRRDWFAGELIEIHVVAGGVKPRVVKEFSHSSAMG